MNMDKPARPMALLQVQIVVKMHPPTSKPLAIINRYCTLATALGVQATLNDITPQQRQTLVYHEGIYGAALGVQATLNELTPLQWLYDAIYTTTFIT